MEIFNFRNIQKKYLKVFLTSLILSNFLFINAQPCNPATVAGNIVVVNSNICNGGLLSASFSFNFAIQNGAVNWSFTGSGNGATTVGPYTYNKQGMVAGGILTASGNYWNGSRFCPFSRNVTVNVFNPLVTITSPIIFNIGSNVVLNSTIIGAGSTPVINWQPNNYYVSGSSNAVEDPVVSPPTSTTYDITVTDSYGCTAKASVDLIANTYAKLTKIPEGAYYNLTSDGKLLFMYDAQYANTSLKYYVFDKNNTIVADYSGINATNTMNSLVVNSGDNRYYLNASALGSGYYILQVINEKNEKLYLRFLK